MIQQDIKKRKRGILLKLLLGFVTVIIIYKNLSDMGWKTAVD